jgi:ABC-type multidrug transport system fused ATPase/permease subunit
LDKIITGDGRLALWHYTPEEWIRFIASDFEEEKIVKKNMFILVVAIALIVGVLLMIVLQDALIMLIIGGIIVLVAIPAYWAPRYRYRKLKKSRTFALIAENGVVIGKMFHLWVTMGASLDDVSLNVKENPNLIEFTYSYPVRHGRQEEVARVPVPYGKYDEAVNILKHFKIKC